jgi:hypothetical protein
MSDTIHGSSPPQFGSLLRSVAFDSKLSLGQILWPDWITHVVGQELGKTADRIFIFTPLVTRVSSSAKFSAMTIAAAAPWRGCWPGMHRRGCPNARPTPAATAKPGGGYPRQSCAGWSESPPTASNCRR